MWKPPRNSWQENSKTHFYWKRDQGNTSLGGKKEKPKMACPFLASITSDFESKITYHFSQNIEYFYSSSK